MGSVFSSNSTPSTPPLQAPKPDNNIRKILLLSNSGEGKSSLLLRYADGVYTDSYISTIGVDFKIKTVEINNEQYKLQIWDLAGEERFRTISSSYYRGAHGIIIVSDITNPELLEQASFWINEIKKYTDNGNISIIWTGSKCDLENERKTSLDDIYKFAEDNQIQYIETSAKDNINIDLLFTTLLCQIENLPTPNQSRMKSARK